MNFLKDIISSAIGFFIAILITSILFFSAIAGVATFFSPENDLYGEVSEKTILSLDLNYPIIENPPALEKFQKSFGLIDNSIDLNIILNAIKIAKSNNKVKGISINSGMIDAGWAQTKTIRDELLKFKESGKFIYSFSDFYSQKGYYLASVSDSIFINKLGSIEFKGLSSQVQYYKDFQEKYGFKMEVIRNGKYKSAVEPYLDNKMSKENKNQLKSIIDAYWDIISSEISLSRGINLEELNSIAENLKASSSDSAINLNLIDDNLYKKNYLSRLKKASEIDSFGKLNKIKPEKLVGLSPSFNKEVRDLIAVIYAQGPILYGKGSESYIGQDIFIESIDECIKDDRIKAIVLRVNSPGGSAITSDIIWNSIEMAKLKKPVVVSMGDMAASGGYYISCNADKIVANPFTLTGSIGVFGILPNINKFSKSVGINTENVKTHKNAEGYSIFEEISPDYRKSLQEGIKQVYSTFKTRVSNGRNIPIPEVEKISQGRVWSGVMAVENGLVDQLGNLDDALSVAAELSETKEYNTIEYPIVEPNIENLLGIGIPMGKIYMNKIEKISPVIRDLLIFFDKSLNNNLRFQTQLPFSIKIE